MGGGGGIGTAGNVCGAGSMQLSGVRPSVSLSHPATARRCCGFAAVGPAARRYQSATRPAVSSSAPQHGAQQQMPECQN